MQTLNLTLKMGMKITMIVILTLTMAMKTTIALRAVITFSMTSDTWYLTLV